MSLLDGFLARALLAGLGVALVAGPLGCFIVWRRMAYFGDATAHASILGVALALALSLPVFVGALVVALAVAGGITVLTTRGLATDTALGVLAHSALAAGLVAVALLGLRVDLEVYLFGDILAVGRTDLAVIWAGALAVLALLAWRWQRLLIAVLNPDLAEASGIDARREQMALTLALAVVVAVAIKVVGALLISAMLIIPAAAARPLSATPERMAALAAALAATSAGGGVWASWTFDTPTGPTIVCAAAALFLCVTAATWRRR
ncbi:metal ABC transporter permease [Jannaschia formosa]|uniref:metal ABC transporter permease n=1 Tax=Jannaschia formosa TaxID=2259592 RepID=UPI000E1BFF57|nr:metal ABC transporter permease [Jannaschia formosa]TFL18938.1 hypothetical protein DR046_05875 [Jannaschia formosa]